MKIVLATANRDKVAELRPIQREAFLKRQTFPGEEGLCGTPHRPSCPGPVSKRFLATGVGRAQGRERTKLARIERPPW
jgi:hypothetical protein